jgi:ABC-2 type transport system permease protein
MIRLLEIEWRKNYNYLAFWLILGLHYFFLVTFLSNINNFAGSMNISTDQYKNIDLGIVPMFRFPDIWQNITYLAGFFKILLGIFIVISVTNEYQFNTIRLNLSAGLTRLEFILSKVYSILVISLLSVLVLFVLGLTLGLSQKNPDLTIGVLTGTDFLLGYFIEVFFYLVLALFISVWLKRTGVSIVILLIYPLLIEPLLRWQTPDSVDRFFPVKSMDQINVFPFQKYFGMAVQSHIPLDSTVIAVGWIFIFIFSSYLLLKRADL